MDASLKDYQAATEGNIAYIQPGTGLSSMDMELLLEMQKRNLGGHEGYSLSMLTNAVGRPIYVFTGSKLESHYGKEQKGVPVSSL